MPVHMCDIGTPGGVTFCSHVCKVAYIVGIIREDAVLLKQEIHYTIKTLAFTSNILD